MDDFINFKKFITGWAIKIAYLFGVLAITIFGFITIFSDNGNILFGIAIILFGNLIWRLFCEINILFFRINENLDEIRKKIK